MPDVLVIYHAPCVDGFASAYVANRYFRTAGRQVEFFGGKFGNPPPYDKIVGKDVYILDFSYSIEMINKIAELSNKLIILDHHKTALKDLETIVNANPPRANIEAIFDMERSGAGLTWDYFYPGRPRPWLIDYVEDRDLWRFKIEDAEVVNAYISTIPYTFEAWDEAAQFGPRSINPDGWGMVLIAGKAVTAKISNYVAEARKHAFNFDFEGYVVPIVNAQPTNISELVGGLAQGAPFAMGWYQGADGKFVYSLRSNNDLDVSAIAKKYGGGGHRQASGFVLDYPIHMTGLDPSVPKSFAYWAFWSVLVTVAWLVAYLLMSQLLPHPGHTNLAVNLDIPGIVVDAPASAFSLTES